MVLLLGNVGADPVIKTTKDGKRMAVFSMVTNDEWKDRATGERRTRSEWHNIVVFQDGLVNVVENYVKKGSKLHIIGNLQTREYVDNNGNKRYSTEVVLQNHSAMLTMLDSKKDSQDRGAGSGFEEDLEIF